MMKACPPARVWISTLALGKAARDKAVTLRIQSIQRHMVSQVAFRASSSLLYQGFEGGLMCVSL